MHPFYSGAYRLLCPALFAGSENQLSEVVGVVNSPVTLHSVTKDVILWRFVGHLSKTPHVIYFDERTSDRSDEKYVVEHNGTSLSVAGLSFADAGTYLSYSSSMEVCVIQLTVIGESPYLLARRLSVCLSVRPSVCLSVCLCAPKN